MRRNLIFWFCSLFFMGTLLTACNDDDGNGPDPDPQTVTDADGNVYPIITLGAQTWMAENLKTTRYSDGFSIHYPGNDDNGWSNNTSGAYAWYNNDENNKDRYGAVYNWYAVKNDRGLCPTGWRVSSFDDWSILMNFLFNEHGITNELEDVNAVGNKLKSCRQVDSPLGGECATAQHPRWHPDPVQFGTDDFNFGALPGGGRTNRGEYQHMGIYGYWWTSSEDAENNGRYRGIFFDTSILLNGGTAKNVGIAVRCIKN